MNERFGVLVNIACYLAIAVLLAAVARPFAAEHGGTGAPRAAWCAPQRGPACLPQLRRLAQR